MITYEDECVGCSLELGCLGSSCPYINVKHFLCDWCDNIFDHSELRYYKDGYICKDCYLSHSEETWESLDKVNENDE